MRDWQDIWRRLFPGRTIARDVDTEIEFHVDGRIADLIDKGLTPRQARAEVLRRFGDVDSFREQCRELSRQRVATEEFRTMMESIGQDTRFAARALLKNAAFSTVVIVTLALAIGATTAIFSVVNGVLLQPLPYEDPGGLAVIWGKRPGHRNDPGGGLGSRLLRLSRPYPRVHRHRHVCLWPGHHVTRRWRAASR